IMTSTMLSASSASPPTPPPARPSRIWRPPNEQPMQTPQLRPLARGRGLLRHAPLRGTPPRTLHRGPQQPHQGQAAQARPQAPAEREHRQPRSVPPHRRQAQRPLTSLPFARTCRRTETHMTATIEGELIAAPSSAEMSSWKSRIGALEASDPERAELEITGALTFSNEMLRAVSDVTAHAPADGAALASAGIGAAKLTAVRAAEFSKRLDLSKDTVLEAQMQQRRWERALGSAIREGQERGEIATKGG